MANTILTAVETGYRRILYNDNLFLYNGSWSTPGTTNYKQSYTIGDTITFKFYGSKLRLNVFIKTYRPGAISYINIDDITETFSPFSDEVGYYRTYEKNLTMGLHVVTITVKDVKENSSGVQFNSIDIDDTGFLVYALPYNEPTLVTNVVQILSKNYEADNVIRKDCIGNLEECTLATIETLETLTKVSNNVINTTSIKTVSVEEFVFE